MVGFKVSAPGMRVRETPGSTRLDAATSPRRWDVFGYLPATSVGVS
jgi:hypothetical protein